jgi:hypothetical protein
MRLSFGISAVVILLAQIGIAAEKPGPWTARAVPPPPRWNLPTVDVRLGFNGPYMPTWNAPIVLSANATAPFDGYIGFRFGVGRAHTKDVPILSRAVLQAGRRWSFHTTIQLEHPHRDVPLKNRELIVEWRDPMFNVVARRNVGRPPWDERRPLRIASAPAPDVARYLGADAVILTPDECHGDAQWYAGFAAIAVPVDTWLDLPAAKRQTIFHSGVRILFFGAPRKGQTLSPIDEALLPVRFEADGTWRAREDAEYVGSELRSRLVRTAAAIYGGGEDVLRETLPFASAIIVGRNDIRIAPSFLRQFVPPSPRPLLSGIAALILVPIVWLRLKRKSDLRVIAVALAAGVVILMMRQWSRPTEGVHVIERWQTVTSGIVRHLWEEEVFGSTPLPASSLSAAEKRSVVAHRGAVHQDGEVRVSETAPGHGSMLYQKSAWDNTQRLRSRLELETGPQVRIIDTARDQLVLEYKIARPADGVIAFWTWRGAKRAGYVRLHDQQGRLTIDEGTLRHDFWQWDDTTYWRTPRDGRTEWVKLSFVENERPWRARVTEWVGRGPESAVFIPYEVALDTAPNASHELVRSYQLQKAPFPESGTVTLFIDNEFAAATAEIIGERGTVALERQPSRSHLPSRFKAPASRVAQVAGPGEVLRVRITSSAPTDQPLVEVKLMVTGNKS